MNICLLNDSFPPVIDGVVNVMMNYADYLMREHQSAIIVGTPRYPGADYRQYAYPVIAYPSLDTAAVTNGSAMQMVGVGFVVSVIQDSMETALNSSGDVIFTATAEFREWKKQGKKLPL